MNQLTEELQCVRMQKEALLSEQNADTSAEEMKKLLSTATAEREQLSLTLQQNTEMASDFAFSLHLLDFYYLMLFLNNLYLKHI